MKKSTKISLIAGASLFIIGTIIFTGVMSVMNWDFLRLSTTKYEVNSYEINDEFTNVSVNTSTADITFVLSEDGKTKIVCEEEANEKHNVYVSDGSLKIELSDQRKWYQHIGINFKSPKITVYLGKSEFDSLNVKASTGDIKIPVDFKFSSIDIKLSTGNVENYASALYDVKIVTSTGAIKTGNMSAKNLSLNASTGKITVNNVKAEENVSVNATTGKVTLSNVTCKNFASKGSTGKLVLSGVVAEGEFDIKRSTGDVNMEKCDAGEITVTTDTGNVSGSLNSEKVFITKTDTGSINVPETVSGGKCRISTDTGDIKIDVIAR